MHAGVAATIQGLPLPASLLTSPCFVLTAKLPAADSTVTLVLVIRSAEGCLFVWASL